MKKKCLVIFILVLNVSLLGYEENKVGALLEMIEMSWANRDGIAWFVYHKAIIQLILLCPDETLKWMEMNNKISNEFFRDWKRTVFQDNFAEDIPKEYFIELKNRIKEKIEKTSFDDSKTEQFKICFLNEINKLIL